MTFPTLGCTHQAGPARPRTAALIGQRQVCGGLDDLTEIGRPHLDQEGDEHITNRVDDILMRLSGDVFARMRLAVADGVVGQFDLHDDRLGAGSLGGGMAELAPHGDGR